MPAALRRGIIQKKTPQNKSNKSNKSNNEQSKTYSEMGDSRIQRVGLLAPPVGPPGPPSPPGCITMTPSEPGTKIHRRREISRTSKIEYDDTWEEIGNRVKHYWFCTALLRSFVFAMGAIGPWRHETAGNRKKKQSGDQVTRVGDSRTGIP